MCGDIVFSPIQFKFKYCGARDHVKCNESFKYNSKRYVEIQKQHFIIDDVDYKVIQILDVSAKILFNQAAGEKKLLTLVNATVSHEMRTPINSITSQNI